MELTTLLLRDLVLAFVVATGFALLFNTPWRVIRVAGVLGGLGHGLRMVLLYFGADIIPSTLVASVSIGLAGIFFARRVHTPPVVFTMPACITMVPGLFAYRAMLGCIKIIDPATATRDDDLLPLTVRFFVLTASLLFALAIGICVGPLVFRKKSIKSVIRQTF